MNDSKNTCSLPLPFLHSGNNSHSVILEQVIALLPLIIWATFRFSFRVPLLCLISVGFSFLTDLLIRTFIRKILKKDIHPFDLYPIFIGICVVCMLPANASLAAVLLFDLAAVAVLRLFGQAVSPIATAYTVMLALTANFSAGYLFSNDERTVSTLDILMKGELPDFPASDIFLGRCDGMIGEISVILILVCGIYLILRGHISWEIPIAAIVSAFVVALEFAPDNVEYYQFAISQTLSGGIFFGSVFIAAPNRFTPTSTYGRMIYGLLIGAGAMFLRLYAHIDGIYPSIAFFSLFIPLIDRFTVPSPFGGYTNNGKSKTVSEKNGR